jgi:hypothetical protein
MRNILSLRKSGLRSEGNAMQKSPDTDVGANGIHPNSN